ncbi:MAG TPA: plasmid pRiA4b ORF-3 family protein [Prolixibacteraceae bacterium]|nr:plasmid pRiA4b ORF-3 family protein [Prolixibacteraceae bacterium]
MANKKKGKVVQMLSPKNYIRQKARTLPVYECKVNSNWADAGLANLSIARKHSNGNLTIGLYMVDLKCLGVKDAHYHFNISEYKYREILEKFESHMQIESITYELAHNIVYAAFEYAEELGFAPHRDFTSVARYILEEDTDDVELIDIECGSDGKPLYVRGEEDTDEQARAIIAHLEKTAGPGNFDFIDIVRDEQADFIDDDEQHSFENHWEDEPCNEDEMYESFNPDFDEETVKNSQTFQFKIAIKGISKPPVWRRVNVPSYFSFMHFHYVIQSVFGWDNYHLYQFSEKGYNSNMFITEINDEFESGCDQLEAETIPISRIFKKEGDKYIYIYDFGDSWEHVITLEKIIPEVSMNPELIAGKGACPPEDCGGVWGYQNMMEALNDKDNPEHHDIREWLGLEEDENWDPGSFDLNDAKLNLSAMFA